MSNNALPTHRRAYRRATTKATWIAASTTAVPIRVILNGASNLPPHWLLPDLVDHAKGIIDPAQA